MLLVKAKVLPSKIHGLGLFADEFIPTGTLIWKFTPGFDLKFAREQILELPEHSQIYFFKYGWRSKKSRLYCFCFDDGKYFNHSENPNCYSEYPENEEEVVTLARRDIRPKEELTDNYSFFDGDKSRG